MSELSQTVIDTFTKSFSTKKPADQDLKDFEERIFSYIEEQRWATRPLVLSPYKCAQYGWKCINPNLLECVTCNAKLCIQEPKIEIYNAYKSCLGKILSDLKDSHKTSCPWPLTPAPESFGKMVPLPKEEALEQFMQRLKECLQFECFIPQIKESLPSQLGLNQKHVTSLCKLAEISLVDVNLISMSIVCMAATGWSLLSKKNGDEKTYAKCNNCQRLIWVKSFNLIDTLGLEEVSPPEIESENENNGLPRKRFKLEKIDFDLLEEHRPWCMWVSNSSSEINMNKENSKESSTPGWMVFIKSLLRNISDSPPTAVEASPSKEQIKNARNLLESWTSPVTN